jgi:hypothetical protein
MDHGYIEVTAKCYNRSFEVIAFVINLYRLLHSSTMKCFGCLRQLLYFSTALHDIIAAKLNMHEKKVRLQEQPFDDNIRFAAQAFAVFVTVFIHKVRAFLYVFREKSNVSIDCVPKNWQTTVITFPRELAGDPNIVGKTNQESCQCTLKVWGWGSTRGLCVFPGCLMRCVES